MVRRQTILATLTLLLVAVVAGPAAAQYGGGPTDPTPPPEEEGQIRTTTECGTIIVTGDNWGGANVYIDREYDGDGCDGVSPPEPDDVDADLPETPEGDASALAEADSPPPLAFPVNEDGTFTAVLVVPAGTDPGRLDVEIIGEDPEGNPKRAVEQIDVTEVSLFVPAEAVDPASEDSSATTYGLVALVLALVLVLAFNAPGMFRRLRR